VDLKLASGYEKRALNLTNSMNSLLSTYLPLVCLISVLVIIWWGLKIENKVKIFSQSGWRDCWIAIRISKSCCTGEVSLTGIQW